MKIPDLLSLIFGATLAIVAACSSVDEPADRTPASDPTAAVSQSSEIPEDSSAAQADVGATPRTACPNAVRLFCLSPITCESSDGVPTSQTCPAGTVCCHLNLQTGK